MIPNEPKGQILPGSRFGDMLTELAKQSETIVEIGTWHGLGSTRCLANGLVRPTQHMYAFEIDTQVCDEAASYYTNEPRIEFVNDSILNDGWFGGNERIDLLLFDGDDLETDEEFATFKHICKVVALDDTNERKNRLQRAIILNHPETWTVLADELNDRLGWMVARRK